MSEIQQKITKHTMRPDNITKIHGKHETIETEPEEIQEMELLQILR